jgi:hypothetical protein
MSLRPSKRGSTLKRIKVNNPSIALIYKDDYSEFTKRLEHEKLKFEDVNILVVVLNNLVVLEV